MDIPLALKAKGPAWSLTVKGINSPKLLGIPSGTGLQKYAGTSEPLVKARVGTAVASTRTANVKTCIVETLYTTREGYAQRWRSVKE